MYYYVFWLLLQAWLQCFLSPAFCWCCTLEVLLGFSSHNPYVTRLGLPRASLQLLPRDTSWCYIFWPDFPLLPDISWWSESWRTTVHWLNFLDTLYSLISVFLLHWCLLHMWYISVDVVSIQVHSTPPITKKNMWRFCFIIGGFSLRKMYLQVNRYIWCYRQFFVKSDFVIGGVECIINSVLLLFICSLFSSIHVLMSVVHSLSSLILVVSLFLDLAGKLFLYPWSSTNPCRSISLGITSCRFEALAEYRFAPKQDPCGTEKGRSITF